MGGIAGDWREGRMKRNWTHLNLWFTSWWDIVWWWLCFHVVGHSPYQVALSQSDRFCWLLVILPPFFPSILEVVYPLLTLASPGALLPVDFPQLATALYATPIAYHLFLAMTLTRIATQYLLSLWQEGVRIPKLEQNTGQLGIKLWHYHLVPNETGLEKKRFEDWGIWLGNGGSRELWMRRCLRGALRIEARKIIFQPELLILATWGAIGEMIYGFQLCTHTSLSYMLLLLE